MQSNQRTQSLFEMFIERPRSQRALFLWVATAIQLLFLLLLFLLVALSLSPTQSVFGKAINEIFLPLLSLAFFSLLYTAFAYIHYGACLICANIPNLSERAQRHMRLWEPAISVSYVLFAAPLLVTFLTAVFPFHIDWLAVDILGQSEGSPFVFGIFYFFTISLSLLNILLRRAKYVSIFVAILVGSVYMCAGIGTFYESSEGFENTPDLYSDISTFADTHGKYVINYDGDYWLTYYTDKNACYKSSVKCDPDWVKTGNASITYSPIPLEPFRDKEVIVRARQLRISSSLSNDYGAIRKYLCIGSYANCKPSTGPGVWYRSPLIIKSIQSK